MSLDMSGECHMHESCHRGVK